MLEKTYVIGGENAGGFWAPEKLIPIPRPLIAEELEAKERLENVMNYYKLDENIRYRLLKGMIENIERKRKDEQEMKLLPYRVERIEEDEKSAARIQKPFGCGRNNLNSYCCITYVESDTLVGYRSMKGAWI